MIARLQDRRNKDDTDKGHSAGPQEMNELHGDWPRDGIPRKNQSRPRAAVRTAKPQENANKTDWVVKRGVRSGKDGGGWRTCDGKMYKQIPDMKILTRKWQVIC